MSEPFVTVILAVRNEAPYIARCLSAVLAQDWPSDRLEIIVADGESTDGTPDIIRSLPGSERVRLIINPGRRQAAGLNLAIAQAEGDVIVRVDGHTLIASDYVRRCVSALEETGASCVGGRIQPVGLTPVGSVIAAVARTAFAVPGAVHISRSARFTDTVYLGAWPTDMLVRVGGYDERLRTNEDFDLAYRIREAGGRVYLTPNISSKYFGRQTLGALGRQYFLYGIGKSQVLLAHPRSLRIRQLVAPLFIAALVCGLIFWIPVPAAHMLCLGILLAYVLLNLSFSAFVTVRERPHAFWLAPVAYMTIHLCWGAGFWVGMLLYPRFLARSHKRNTAYMPLPQSARSA
jgi:glycosyltransferase involved in cell wall biosynthesis